MLDQERAVLLRVIELLDGLEAVTVGGTTLSNQYAVTHYFREWRGLRDEAHRVAAQVRDEDAEMRNVTGEALP